MSNPTAREASEKLDSVQDILARWTSMECFLLAIRFPDDWIRHARKYIPLLVAWLKTEQEMHAAWRKRAEEAEAAAPDELANVKRALRHAINFVHDGNQPEPDWTDPLLGNQISGPVATMRREHAAAIASAESAIWDAACAAVCYWCERGVPVELRHTERWVHMPDITLCRAHAIRAARARKEGEG